MTVNVLIVIATRLPSREQHIHTYIHTYTYTYIHIHTQAYVHNCFMSVLLFSVPVSPETVVKIGSELFRIRLFYATTSSHSHTHPTRVPDLNQSSSITLTHLLLRVSVLSEVLRRRQPLVWNQLVMVVKENITTTSTPQQT